MKVLPFAIAVAALFMSCTNKKMETQNNSDSVFADTLQLPNSITLAFSPLENYALKSNLQLPDSVNFLLIANTAMLDSLLTKTNMNEIENPDFVINYNVAIATSPSALSKRIEIERVELSESKISVFVVINESKAGSIATPVRVFAIERRSAVSEMDFYLMGRKVKSLMLPVN